MCTFCDEYQDEPQCEMCGTWRNVSLRIDPYIYEIEDGEEVLRHLCGDCYDTRKDDV